MNYEVITLACEQLSYREKLKLAQYLIQTARREEEVEHPVNRLTNVAERKKSVKQPTKVKTRSITVNHYDYAEERILKLKPTKRSSLLNSINAMFQFQGGISEKEVNEIILRLQKNKKLVLNNNKVSYVK
ncbi:hypothetical protein GNP61_19470 [Aliivibrio fischeri]|uniref:hypothetical protein n=1 Tax=Aliivibrio fischeri TaxID=668 RepID=UPI0012DA4702|nr:hypothetical protein [Aliivibrio fischeri]MUK43727.1 hypothetical protein [Aliivibrio fischeri]